MGRVDTLGPVDEVRKPRTTTLADFIPRDSKTIGTGSGDSQRNRGLDREIDEQRPDVAHIYVHSPTAADFDKSSNDQSHRRVTFAEPIDSRADICERCGHVGHVSAHCGTTKAASKLGGYCSYCKSPDHTDWEHYSVGRVVLCPLCCYAEHPGEPCFKGSPDDYAAIYDVEDHEFNNPDRASEFAYEFGLNPWKIGTPSGRSAETSPASAERVHVQVAVVGSADDAARPRSPVTGPEPLGIGPYASYSYSPDSGEAGEKEKETSEVRSDVSSVEVGVHGPDFADYSLDSFSAGDSIPKSTIRRKILKAGARKVRADHERNANARSSPEQQRADGLEGHALEDSAHGGDAGGASGFGHNMPEGYRGPFVFGGDTPRGPATPIGLDGRQFGIGNARAADAALPDLPWNGLGQGRDVPLVHREGIPVNLPQPIARVVQPPWMINPVLRVPNTTTYEQRDLMRSLVTTCTYEINPGDSYDHNHLVAHTYRRAALTEIARSWARRHGRAPKILAIGGKMSHFRDAIVFSGCEVHCNVPPLRPRDKIAARLDPHLCTEMICDCLDEIDIVIYVDSIYYFTATDILGRVTLWEAANLDTEIYSLHQVFGTIRGRMFSYADQAEFKYRRSHDGTVTISEVRGNNDYQHSAADWLKSQGYSNGVDHMAWTEDNGGWFRGQREGFGLSCTRFVGLDSAPMAPPGIDPDWMNSSYYGPIEFVKTQKSLGPEVLSRFKAYSVGGNCTTRMSVCIPKDFVGRISTHCQGRAEDTDLYKLAYDYARNNSRNLNLPDNEKAALLSEAVFLALEHVYLTAATLRKEYPSSAKKRSVINNPLNTPFHKRLPKTGLGGYIRRLMKRLHKFSAQQKVDPTSARNRFVEVLGKLYTFLISKGAKKLWAVASALLMFSAWKTFTGGTTFSESISGFVYMSKLAFEEFTPKWIQVPCRVGKNWFLKVYNKVKTWFGENVASKFYEAAEACKDAKREYSAPGNAHLTRLERIKAAIATGRTSFRRPAHTDPVEKFREYRDLCDDLGVDHMGDRTEEEMEEIARFAAGTCTNAGFRYCAGEDQTPDERTRNGHIDFIPDIPEECINLPPLVNIAISCPVDITVDEVCVHNELAALKGRVLSDPTNIETDFWAREKAAFVARFAYPIEVDWPLWLSRYPNRKQRLIREADAGFGAVDVCDAAKIKAHIKIECGYHRRLVSSPDTPDQIKPHSPRLIQASMPGSKNVVGPYIWAWSRHTASDRDYTEYLGKCTYGPSMRAEDLDEWFRVCFVMMGGRRVRIICGDYVRQDKSRQRKLVKAYVAACRASSFPEHVVEQIIKDSRDNKGYTPHGVVYFLKNGMRSGWDGTTHGNTCGTIYICEHACMGLRCYSVACGDDTYFICDEADADEVERKLVKRSRNAGFELTLHSTNEIHRGEFCSGRFWPAATESGYAFGMKPGKLIPKLFVVRDLTKISSVPKHIRSVCIGLDPMVNHDPLSAAYVRRCLALVGDGRKVRSNRDKQFVRYTLPHITRINPAPVDEARFYDACADIYDVTETTFREMIAEINAADLGDDLKHPAWKKLNRVDRLGEPRVAAGTITCKALGIVGRILTNIAKVSMALPAGVLCAKINDWMAARNQFLAVCVVAPIVEELVRFTLDTNGLAAFTTLVVTCESATPGNHTWSNAMHIGNCAVANFLGWLGFPLALASHVGVNIGAYCSGFRLKPGMMTYADVVRGDRITHGEAADGLVKKSILFSPYVMPRNRSNSAVSQKTLKNRKKRARYRQNVSARKASGHPVPQRGRQGNGQPRPRKFFVPQNYATGRGAYHGGTTRRSVGGQIGGALGKMAGGALGMPELEAIGSMLGKGAEALTSVFGFGKYRGYSFKKNSLISGDTDPPVIMNVRGNEGTIFTHREFFTDVFSGPTLVGGSTVFNIQTYPITPTNPALNPWLANQANGFQEWEPLGQLIEFVSECGNTTTSLALGAVMLAAQYDPLNAAPESKIQLLQLEHAMAEKPDKNMIMPIECAPRLNVLREMYIPPGGVPPVNSDEQFYFLGNLCIATEGQPVINTKLGQIWQTYQIRCMKPILNQPVVYSEHLAATIGTPTNAAPFGTLLVKSGNLGLTKLNNTITFSEFLAGEQYLILMSWQGTTAVAVVGPTLTTTGCVELNIWNGESESELVVPVALTSAALVIAFMVTINPGEDDGALPSFTLGGSGTIPTANCQFDLTVTQLSTTITA